MGNCPGPSAERQLLDERDVVPMQGRTVSAQDSESPPEPAYCRLRSNVRAVPSLTTSTLLTCHSRLKDKLQASIRKPGESPKSK